MKNKKNIMYIVIIVFVLIITLFISVKTDFKFIDKFKNSPEETINPWEYSVDNDLFYCCNINWNSKAAELIQTIKSPSSINYEWGLIKYTNQKFLDTYTTNAEVTLDNVDLQMIDCIINLNKNQSYDEFYNEFIKKLDETCKYSASSTPDSQIFLTETTEIDFIKISDYVIEIIYKPAELRE